MTSNSCSLLAWACAFASLGAAGCLCPPCPGKGVAAGPAPAEDNAAAPVAVGSRLVIWDGDETGTGARDWADCDQKPNCVSKVEVKPGIGIKDSNGLKFHGEGVAWIGMGWNLFNWDPPNAGIDLTPYSHLTFQLRVESKTPGAPVDPGAPRVVLGCSGNKNDSGDAPFDRFAKGFGDGKWHKVSIPISTFTKGKGAKFDLHSFWEFRISTWSGNQRSFDIYVDDIAAEKQ